MPSLYLLNIVGAAAAGIGRIGVILFGLVLYGCAQTGGIQTSIVPVTVAPEKALVFLSPGSFDALTIVQTNYSNAVVQQIYLRTDALTSGQNYVKATYWGPVGPQYEARENLPYVAFHQARLAAEMQADFPSTRMVISPDYLQNDYGAFSYAIGKGVGNDLCLFGWQQIRTADENRTLFGDTGMIQIRLRLCQAGATQNTLLSVMYHYTLTGAFNSSAWNPYGAPPRLAANIGTAGQPLYPIGRQGELDKPVAATPLMVHGVRPVNVRPASVQPVNVQKVQQVNREPSNAPQPVAPMAATPGAVMPQIPAPPVSTSQPSSQALQGMSTDTMGAGSSRPFQKVTIPSPPCPAGRTNATCE
nr:cellulose biosynthesis protein BcsN [Rhizobium oryziradicis]